MLVSLTHRKRVDHAIKGIGLANDMAEAPFDLNIFGQGPLRESLQALISKLGMEDRVRLGGFDSEPRARLAQASFVLLTSRMEGLPLVLLEAMSVGCIPIAYDMPYGPADIIVDGVNGYLVEAGDIEALAGALVRLSTLSTDDVQRMRQAARKTAERFDDRSVTVEWARVMSSGRRSKAHSTGRFAVVIAHGQTAAVVQGRRQQLTDNCEGPVTSFLALES